MKYRGTLRVRWPPVVLVLSLIGPADCPVRRRRTTRTPYYGYRIRTVATRSEDEDSGARLGSFGGLAAAKSCRCRWCCPLRTREEALDAAMSHAMEEVDRRRAATGKP